MGQAENAGLCSVGGGLSTCFFERDEREAAEFEFAAASEDGKPLDPTPDAGGLNLQIEALAVAIAASLGRRRVFTNFTFA